MFTQILWAEYDRGPPYILTGRLDTKEEEARRRRAIQQHAKKKRVSAGLRGANGRVWTRGVCLKVSRREKLRKAPQMQENYT